MLLDIEVALTVVVRVAVLEAVVVARHGLALVDKDWLAAVAQLAVLVAGQFAVLVLAVDRPVGARFVVQPADAVGAIMSARARLRLVLEQVEYPVPGLGLEPEPGLAAQTDTVLAQYLVVIATVS